MDKLPQNMNNNNGKQQETQDGMDTRSNSGSSNKDQRTLNGKQRRRLQYEGVNTEEVSESNLALVKCLLRPTQDALVVEIGMFLLKTSRIFLVLGLLAQLFLQLSCSVSNIHLLLLCAFVRDIVSGLFDIKAIYALSTARLRLKARKLDSSVKELAHGYFEVSSQVDGRYDDMKFLMNESERLCSQGHSSLIALLKGCFYILFLASLIFVLHYDDEIFCHVFEKYAVIYLFLPYYTFLLIIALFIKSFGLILAICIIILLCFIIIQLKRRYRQISLEQPLRIQANSLKSKRFAESSIQGLQCLLCSGEYHPDDQVCILKCFQAPHHFHRYCLVKWAATQGCCPLCQNQDLSS